MEHTWILYALGWMLSAGIMDYNKKIVLVRWYSAESYLLTTSLLFLVFFWSYAFFFWNGVFTSELFLQGSVYGLTNFLTPLGMITAYKYSSVSFSLVSIRLIASFLLLLVGVYFIGDSVSFFNILGFIFWMIAIFLLSGFKKWEIGKVHIKAIFGIIIAICSIVFGHSFLKYIIGEVDIPNFMAIQTSSGLFFLVIYLLLRNKFSGISLWEMLKVSKYSLVPVTLFPLFLLYFLPNLYLYWPLSLGYKILSYSIIIPILLSIIFLWEPVNKTRIFAFGLTVLSIFLFLV